jgi:hypothetical protein
LKSCPAKTFKKGEIMIKETQVMGTTEALKFIEKETGGVVITLPTLISWIKKYALGRKIGARWYVDKNAFTEYLKEKK